jgi:hypothetical protein
MNRHLEWLLAACRFWLTGEPADAPARDPENWHELASFGYFHDLDPLLHHLAADRRLGLEARLPKRVERQWEGAYYRNFVFNTELVDLVGRLLDGCSAQGIEARVFKGPVTAIRGWLDPALRIMADVDLLCREADLPKLAALARELGFETGQQTATHHLALRHGSLPGSLELHFELYEVFGGDRRLLDEIWTEPCSVTMDERELPALDPELAVVLDLAHLLQHDLQVNLRQILDLAATLWRQRRLLDRARLRTLLNNADLAPEFEQALAMLQNLGLPVDDDLQPGRPPRATALTASVTERLLRPDELHRVGAFSGPHRRDGAADTAGYLWRRLVPPLGQLQAMTGAESRSRALLGYPAHVATTLRRGALRWRRGERKDPDQGFSLKAELFDRRRTDRRR